MKTVFTNSEIVHVWASQKQESGRSNSMKFDGKTFYSYQMPIAQFVTAPNNMQVVLLDKSRVSVTTSGHQSEVARAVRHLPTIEVFKINRYGDVEDCNQSEYVREIESAIKNAARARTQFNQDRHLDRARELASYMAEYSVVFNLDWTIPTIPNNLTAAKIQVKAESKEKAEKTRLAKIEALKEATEARDKWLAGDNGYHYNSRAWSRLLPTELRIMGAEIETSQGARFPLAHAKRGLILVEAVKASGIEWKRNGHTCHLGHYQIDRIESNGTVHAGCHVVPYAAIERIKDAILAYVPTVESEVA